MLRAFTLPECPSPSLRHHLANLKKSVDIIHLAAARLLITAGQTATRIICLMAETGEFGWSRTTSSRVRSDLVALHGKCGELSTRREEGSSTRAHHSRTVKSAATRTCAQSGGPTGERRAGAEEPGLPARRGTARRRRKRLAR